MDGFEVNEEEFPSLAETTIPPVPISCSLCKEKFKTPEELKKHLGCDKHAANYIKARLKFNIDEYRADKKGVAITCPGPPERATIPMLQVISEPCKTLKFAFKINYTSDVNKPLYFHMCTLIHKMPVFQLRDQHGVTENRTIVTMNNGETYEIHVVARADFVGLYRVPVMFTFTLELEEAQDQQPKKPFFIVRILELCCKNKLVEELEPVIPYNQQGPVYNRTPVRKRILIGNMTKQKFPIPESIKVFMKRHFKEWPEMSEKERLELAHLKDVVAKGLTEESYTEFFRTLLFIEEMQMQYDISQYDMEKADLHLKPGNLFQLYVAGLAEKRPSVLKNDKIYVRFRLQNNELDDIEYEGVVELVYDTSLIIRFHEKFVKRFIKGMKVDVRFTFNRWPQEAMHEAVEGARQKQIKRILFPKLSTAASYKPYFNISSFPMKYFDGNILTNPEQQKAVMHILAATSRPAPYLLFGPPGTGKTVTVVEAIKQIFYHLPKSRILVATQSNSAADVVAKRLLKHISSRHILRQYAVSFEYKKVPEEIRHCCNYDDRLGSFFFPESWKELESKRVIICSLITSCRLKHLAAPNNFITHVFIDEAGQAVEPETIIPLGLLSKVQDNGGLLVLAGDPEQLGPVLLNNMVAKAGLGKSLLERLMKDCEVYQRRNGQFDPRVLTKLVQNYRSHPAILKLPNELFYDEELKACANELERNSLCRWDGLPSRNFPVIFHGVFGRDLREGNSPSYYNPEEVVTVIQYVDSLLSVKRQGIVIRKSDIGVISPYRRQVQKLKRDFAKRHWDEVSVGSVEEYQGQERRIIIITTVRSNVDLMSFDHEFRLGFLKNPKRFNVSITRAKALLIVIGNPYILCRDKHWGKLLKYCQMKGGYTGIPFTNPKDITDSIFESVALKTDFLSEMPELISQRVQHEEPQWRSEA